MSYTLFIVLIFTNVFEGEQKTFSIDVPDQTIETCDEAVENLQIDLDFPGMKFSVAAYCEPGGTNA